MNPRPAIFSDRHAFLIGAQTYTDAGIRPLKTPTQDIRLMANALAAYGYTTHLSPDPNRAAFVGFLENIATQVTDPDAQIVIYYAGHGVALTQQQTDGPPSYSGYLLPVDAERGRLTDTAISMQWVSALIERLAPKQILLVLDCCYAGAVRQATGFRGGIDTDLTDISQDDFGHYTRYRAAQILTSSAHNQQALDQYVGANDQTTNADPAGTYSPFALLLSRALTNRDADTNRDGIVTVSELQQYVQQRLEAAAAMQDHEQTACLFGFASHEGGEFMFLEPAFNPANLTQRIRVNPYKGLAAYQPEDSPFFYGRDQAINELNRLMAASKFVVVVGASGTGKSSLVKAGVLGPAHRAGTTHATIRPGKTPLAELTTALKNPPGILLIDQMEELVTQAGDRSDELLTQFFATLTKFLNSPAGQQTKVLATMRIEFAGQINRQDRFWNTRSDAADCQQYTIPVLDVDALQEIIIRPALQTGMFFYPEKETVARIIEDFRHYPNALPLLSLALNELYEVGDARPERTIYQGDYTGIGQILEEKEQTILEPFRDNLDFFRDLLLRFVGFEAGEYARRRVENDELNFGPGQQPVCAQILKTMTDNRLLTGRDAEAGDGYYELTHEALIGSWRTYRQWIQQAGSAQLSQRDELAEAALRHERNGRRRGYVWGGMALLSLIRLGKPTDTGSVWAWTFRPFTTLFGHLSWLSVPERAFLWHSVAVQRMNRIGQGVLGLLLVAVIAVGLFLQRQKAYEQVVDDARNSESQNAYDRAQHEYLRADSLATGDALLRLGRPLLNQDPAWLRPLAHSAAQRHVAFTALSAQLERADTLASRSVVLLAGRSDFMQQGLGVARACRAYQQFIDTDARYRALERALNQPRTKHLLSERALTPFRKRVDTGKTMATVMRQNLLATCREVQEGYQLNGQVDLAAQYGRYAHALEVYNGKVAVQILLAMKPYEKALR